MEAIIVGDNPVGQAVRYFSSYEKLKRWREHEAKLRALKIGKYEADEIGLKQIGMAIEKENEARRLENGMTAENENEARSLGQ
jgi:hypothetical protein